MTSSPSHPPRAAVVIPAYNVAHTLAAAVRQLPRERIEHVLVIDDGSTDATAAVARTLDVRLLSHDRNRGYGAAQKTGFAAAIELPIDLVVLVHGDNQYDPTLAAAFIDALWQGEHDVITGTRMARPTLHRVMPWWKQLANRLLTTAQNRVIGTALSDYHNGYRAYRADFLRLVPLEQFSDGFDFDCDIIIQAALRGRSIGELPHVARYAPEHSQMSLSQGVRYGLRILQTIARLALHRHGWRRQRLFEVQP